MIKVPLNLVLLLCIFSSSLARAYTDLAPGGLDGPAALPIVYMSTQIPAPTGHTYTAVTDSDLASALTKVQCGDSITLQAGNTFHGPITLPKRSCDDSHWITIRPTSANTALPAQGSRINPCYAGVFSLPGRPSFTCPSTSHQAMAKITVDSGSIVPVTFAPGANHYHLMGLEITRAANTGIVYILIGPTQNASMDHIILDRLWVHGVAQDETNHGVLLNGTTNVAIVDSYFSDFHCTTQVGLCIDSQAISGGLGSLPSGPYKIVNNYLEGAGENIIFGGGRSTTTPHDIEIRFNYFFKPLTWMYGQPGFVGGKDTTPSQCGNFDPTGGGQCPFVVKNIFELKNARRVLVEGNIFENNWGQGQNGTGILITPINQTVYLNEPIRSLSRYNNIVTVTLQSTSRVKPGDTMTIKNAPRASFNILDATVLSVPTLTTLTFMQTGPNDTSVGGGLTTGDSPSAVVSDVTFRYNKISHVGGGFAIATAQADQEGCPQGAGNLSFHDVTVDDINIVKYKGTGSPIGVLAEIAVGLNCPIFKNVTFNHITAFPPNGVFLLGLHTQQGACPTMPYVNLTNSIITSGLRPVTSMGGTDQCVPSLSTTSADYVMSTLGSALGPYSVTKNAFTGGDQRAFTWPAGNFFPSLPSNLGFTLYNGGNGGDYSLLSTSLYKNKGTDGKDLGADIQEINSHTSGVK